MANKLENVCKIIQNNILNIKNNDKYPKMQYNRIGESSEIIPIRKTNINDKMIVPLK